MFKRIIAGVLSTVLCSSAITSGTGLQSAWAVSENGSQSSAAGGVQSDKDVSYEVTESVVTHEDDIIQKLSEEDVTDLLSGTSLSIPAVNLIADEEGSAQENADDTEIMETMELGENIVGDVYSDGSLHIHGYISKESAKSILEIKRGKWVSVMPKDYMIKGMTDLLESENTSDMKRKNYYDYDFEKIISDLNMPEKYYRINAENNDFAFYKKSEIDADGNTKDTYVKLASIDVEIAPSVTDEDAIVRLYQLISVWTEQNPLVYSGITFRYGPAPGSKIETIEIETLGDVNADGYINAVDASSVLAYYSQISTNQIGEYTEDQKLSADVNHDKMINAVDASDILSYYAYVSTTKETPMSIEEFIKKN